MFKLTSPQDMQDMGEYFRGLLLMMAADGRLSPLEIDRVRRFGETCGFEEKFVESSIQSVLTNSHISKVPPTFHSSETAARFMTDAAELAACDGTLHPNERDWLVKTAAVNRMEPVRAPAGYEPPT